MYECNCCPILSWETFFSEKFSLGHASMEILYASYITHLGKILLCRKSFCIDETFLWVYNCLINTKKGELTKHEKSLQLFRKT